MPFFARVKRRKDVHYIIIPKEQLRDYDLKSGDYVDISIEEVIHTSDRNNLEN